MFSNQGKSTDMENILMKRLFKLAEKKKPKKTAAEDNPTVCLYQFQHLFPFFLAEPKINILNS